MKRSCAAVEAEAVEAVLLVPFSAEYIAALLVACVEVTMIIPFCEP
jgi:hypothetical protein